MFAKAKVVGLRDSSAEGVPGLGSALRQERGAGKRLSVPPELDRCCPIGRRVRQGIVSAKVISAYARPKKPAQARAGESRATPTGEGDHEVQLVVGLPFLPPLEVGDARQTAIRRRRRRLCLVPRTPVRDPTGWRRERSVGKAQASVSRIEGSSGCS
jgi:hypothetical protein